MSDLRVRVEQTTVAIGLSIVGLGCGVWLLVQAVREFDAAVRWPRGAR